MEKNGVTRRIDNLGRIVIPKEIRRNLKIKDNDQLEINVNENNIILSKYEVLKKDSNITYLLDTLKRKINRNVLYTSRDKIIDSSLVNRNYILSCLDDELINLIESRKETIIKKKDINLFFFIQPIIVNGDLFGSLIIYDNNDFNSNDLLLLDYTRAFLEKYLE